MSRLILIIYETILTRHKRIGLKFFKISPKHTKIHRNKEEWHSSKQNLFKIEKTGNALKI